MSAEAVVFVSDAHFGWGAADHERRQSFLGFLESLHGVGRLLVVGDLFQFWFDIGSTMPKGYFDILHGLRRLRLSGTRIDYVAGNHDYWRGDFFRGELGIDTHAGPLAIEEQGRRILAQHGDGAGVGDLGYKLFKKMVRSPFAMGAARLLHPDLVRWLALRLGALSHGHTSGVVPDDRRLESAARQVFGRGFDALVMGHVHAQVHRRLPGGELLVIGDWIGLRSFVRLESGVFTPGRWTG